MVAVLYFSTPSGKTEVIQRGQAVVDDLANTTVIDGEPCIAGQLYLITESPKGVYRFNGTQLISFQSLQSYSSNDLLLVLKGTLAGSYGVVDGVAERSDVSADQPVEGGVFTVEGDLKVTGGATIAGNTDTASINSISRSELSDAVNSAGFESSGDTLYTWSIESLDTSAWTSSHGISINDSGVFITGGAIGNYLEWTMGTAGTTPSVAGRWYRFNVSLRGGSSSFGIVRMSVDGTDDGQLDLETSSAFPFLTYQTKWYNANDAAMVFRVTSTNKAGGVQIALLQIDILVLLETMN